VFHGLDLSEEKMLTWVTLKEVMINPPRLKHKGFNTFAYRILSYVTVSKIFTKGLIDEINNKH
jgi:hypothetical protein